MLNKLTIKGFKSIKELVDFELKNLNIIVGANGAGKSNLIQVFRMLIAMYENRFQRFILDNGGADDFLYNGIKNTDSIDLALEYDNQHKYTCSLFSNINDQFAMTEEFFDFNISVNPICYSACLESYLYFLNAQNNKNVNEYKIMRKITNFKIYHFHDTSSTAGMRRYEVMQDNKYLRQYGENIAPFLLKLKTNHKSDYTKIVNAIKIVMPFFDDFLLDVVKKGEAEKVRLTWTQKGSDYPMQPYHLSDGSIRFICLATALLQPNPPATIIIDEPELGLHPGAIEVLAELIEIASRNTQVIVATQSPLLLNHFAIDDIIVAKRKDGASTFERLKEEDYNVWLEDYNVGELWVKNVIQGGTTHE